MMQDAAQPQNLSLLATLGASQTVRLGIAIGGTVLTLILLFTVGLRKRRGKIRGGALVLSLLPLVLGTNGVWLSIPVAEFLTLFISVPKLSRYFKDPKVATETQTSPN